MNKEDAEKEANDLNEAVKKLVKAGACVLVYFSAVETSRAGWVVCKEFAPEDVLLSL